MPGNRRLPVSAVTAIFLKCSSRYWLTHRWQAVLMLVGMALGVAVVFAVDIANESAKRAFSLSLDAVTGRTTHQIIGGAKGIDEAVYTKLRTQLGFSLSAPIVDGTVTLLGNGENATETLQLLGVDLFAEPMFRDRQSVTASAGGKSNALSETARPDNASSESTVSDSARSENAGTANADSGRSSLQLLSIGAVVLGDSTADRLGLSMGDIVAVESAGSLDYLRLVNSVDTREQAAFDAIAMVDIATAQELTNFQGRLSRIDLVLPEQSSKPDFEGSDWAKNRTGNQTNGQTKKQIIEQAFPHLQVMEAGRRNNALQQMTSAFHSNLLAMSLLALLVGAFLIYNTVTLSVLQRRPLFGQLRVAGVRRSELFGSIVFETLVFAVIGTAAGLLMGLLLGSVLLTLVTRTINDLYFTLDVRRLDFSAFTLIKAVLIGLGSALIAALAPAMEAANSTPVTVIRRSSVELRARAVVPTIFYAGIVFLAVGALILWLSQKSLWAGFVALFFIVIGYSLMIPAVLVILTSLGARLPAMLNTSMSAMGQYPLRSITASLSRTSIAIAALVVAVSATAGVGIMIGSFRLSVVDWLGNTLQSDLYIRSAASAQVPIPEGLVRQLSPIPGVDGVRRQRSVKVETGRAPATLIAIEITGASSHVYGFRKESNKPRVIETSSDDSSVAIAISGQLSAEQRWQHLLTSDSVLVSEPFAYKHNLKVNDTLTIVADESIKPFTVAGVFTDYNAGQGFVVMAMDAYHRYWSDRHLSSVGLTLSPKANSEAVKSAVRDVIKNSPDRLLMRSNAELREMSLDIFDRTFAITHILRLLTVGVAFVGILSALMALSLERRAEFAVLRALGITPAELRNLLFLQTGLMGIIAGLLALPLGIVMSKILVSVINQRSFGWTMEFIVPPVVVLESVVLAIVAALLAGWYPARQLSQMSPASALRHP